VDEWSLELDSVGEVRRVVSIAREPPSDVVCLVHQLDLADHASKLDELTNLFCGWYALESFHPFPVRNRLCHKVFFHHTNLSIVGAISFGACPCNHRSCQKLMMAPSPRVMLVQAWNSSTSVAESGTVILDQCLFGFFHLNHCQRSRRAPLNLSRSKMHRPPMFFRRCTHLQFTRLWSFFIVYDPCHRNLCLILSIFLSAHLDSWNTIMWYNTKDDRMSWPKQVVPFYLAIWLSSWTVLPPPCLWGHAHLLSLVCRCATEDQDIYMAIPWGKLETGRGWQVHQCLHIGLVGSQTCGCWCINQLLLRMSVATIVGVPCPMLWVWGIELWRQHINLCVSISGQCRLGGTGQHVLPCWVVSVMGPSQVWKASTKEGLPIGIPNHIWLDCLLHRSGECARMCCSIWSPWGLPTFVWTLGAPWPRVGIPTARCQTF
jgi:hypothetical protein